MALELEYGNDVPWVLVEFTYNGSRVRGYTGLKRMELGGYVPYAQHEGLRRSLVSAGTVYAAPDGWLSAYYGGLHGYVPTGDLCDLRFDSPEQARMVLG